jgi:RNA polymerase sigma-70 factor (ECF subfamily)
MTGAADDRELVRRLRAGSEAAFAEFFEGYFPRLYRFVLARVAPDEDLAEDVVQAALSQAVAKLHTYRGEALLFTWLCTFCRYELSARMRQKQRALPAVALLEELPEVRAALESLADESVQSAADEARRGALARLVQATLDHLPLRYGRALEWKYLEGLPVKTIAERLGLGPKAAESLLTRAREAFREAFESAAAAARAAGGEA